MKSGWDEKVMQQEFALSLGDIPGGWKLSGLGYSLENGWWCRLATVAESYWTYAEVDESGPNKALMEAISQIRPLPQGNTWNIVLSL